MDVLLLILSSVYLAIVLYNFFYLLKKYRTNQLKTTLYFLFAVVFFIASATIKILTAITGEKYGVILNGVSIPYNLILIGASISLGRKGEKTALGFVISGWVSMVIWLILMALGVFAIEASIGIISGIASVMSLSAVIILYYYWKITKSSSLFGLAIGQTVSIVHFLFYPFAPVIISDTLIYPIIINNFLNLLGFRDVFKFYKTENTVIGEDN